MGLFNVAFDDFGGLDLSDAADENGGALDLLNVDLDRPGRVRSRDGFLKATAAAGATRYDSIFPLAGTSVTSAFASPGTGANDSSYGITAWTNPSNIASSGTASVLLPASGTSQYLKATNFGFAIPTTATINGIVLSFSGNGGGTIGDSSIRVLKAGVVVGTDKSQGTVVGLWYPAGTLSRSYGGATDLWGTTWTPTQVNASTFGAVVACFNTNFGAVTGTVSAVKIQVLYTLAGSAFVASASAGRIDVVKIDGTIAATLATASDTQQSYVAFGSPATNATYIANTGVTVRKLVGTTFSQPAGMPKAKFIGLQTPDNRLVAANIGTVPTGSGATASTSLVHFAGGTTPGTTPETWGANDYVYLTPGDGEDIQGLASYQNQLFIFKSTKLFVFYGNGTDATGNPIFNYRQISGAGLAAPLAVASSPGGIYFLDRRGIYATTGGPPVKISQAIDPLFMGGSSAFYQSGQINPSALSSASMAWYNERLYIGLALGTSATNDHTLVYDPKTGQWMLWDIPMGAMAASASQPGVLYFTYATGTNDVGQWAPSAYTDDAGVAITARYRSAFQSFDWRGRNLRSGIHNVEKLVRESMVDGSGTIGYTLSNQWVQPANLPSSRTLTLGTAPQVKQARDRTAVKGREFSFQISGTGPWSVEKVILALHGYEDAGLKETGN